jgi:hypothetical protein
MQIDNLLVDAPEFRQSVDASCVPVRVEPGTKEPDPPANRQKWWYLGATTIDALVRHHTRNEWAMAKKRTTTAQPASHWNWDVDDAADAKKLADLPEEDQAAAKKALAEKKRLRAQIDSQVVA